MKRVDQNVAVGGNIPKKRTNSKNTEKKGNQINNSKNVDILNDKIR